MNKIKSIILTLGLIAGIGLVAMPASVSAMVKPCDIDPTSDLCQQPQDIWVVVKNVINTMLYVLGALAVIMIIFGGIRYTTSAGDAKKVEQAKNTILYSVVGVVIALLAFAIVNFVIGVIIPPTT